MNSPGKTPKVLISKVGHDGHDRGAKLLTTVLRDAGIEVVYLGKNQMPEAIVEAALQEDVDVVGISFLAGDHLKFSPRLVKLMKERGLDKVPLIAGGVIPRQDIRVLKDQGVAEVFPPGTTTSQVVDFIRAAAE